VARPWWLALALSVSLVPPFAVGYWPSRPAPQPVVHAADHADHSPQAVTHARLDRTPLPKGVGAEVWDGKLPEWPSGGKVFEVGPGHAYKTIGQALFLAKDGDRVIVYGGSYHGAIRLQRAVWVEGRDHPDLMGHEGTIVQITGKGARVTGLTIWNTGDSLDQEDAGVFVNEAPGAVVAGNTFRDVKFGVVVKASPGSIVAGNSITGKDQDLSTVGDGIRVWFSDGAQVMANTLRRTRELLVEQSKGVEVRSNAVLEGRQGLHLMSAPGVRVFGNYLAGNSTGIYVMYGGDSTLINNWVQNNRGPSGYGIGLKEADNARVEGNWLIGNRVGLYLENAPLSPERPNYLVNNLVAQNDEGVVLTAATHDNHISDNDFRDNLQQVASSGSGSLSANQWTVAGRGNYWSDYPGYDNNRDRIGDLPYAPVRVFEGWMDRQPDLRWFWFTPAATAVDAAARAFPLSAAEPILVDDHPMMAPAPRRDSPWSR